MQPLDEKVPIRGLKLQSLDEKVQIRGLRLQSLDEKVRIRGLNGIPWTQGFKSRYVLHLAEPLFSPSFVQGSSKRHRFSCPNEER
jgi:hypothetical protein